MFEREKIWNGWVEEERKKNEREERLVRSTLGQWDWRVRQGGGREKIWVQDTKSGEVKSEERWSTDRNEEGGEKKIIIFWPM